MKLAKYIGAILIILFVILTYYPIKQFYRFDTLKVGKYKKNTNQIVEVSKAFFLLPGKKSLWALKTETGYEVYTTLSDVNSQRKIIFQIYNEDLEKYKNDPSVYAQIEKTISRCGIKKHDRNGNTSLIKAIYNNDVQNVRGLIEDGADVNRFDKKSHYNPLLLAVASKEVDLEIIEVLLSNGADINLANKDGYFALPFLAHSSSGRVEAAKLLLKYGADVNALTNHAYYRGPYNDYSKEESPLLLAIDKNPGDLAMFLIESGANIHIKDQKTKLYCLE